MRPDVRAAAIALVERNFDDMDLPPEFTIDSIELQGSTASYEWDQLADVGIHVFLAYNGSMCPTSCKAPEGPVCEAACQYDDLARMFNSYNMAKQEATFNDAQGRTSETADPTTGVLFNCLVAEVTIMATKPPSQLPVNGTGLYSFTTDSWIMEPTEQPNNFDKAMKKYRGTGFDANLGSRSTSNLAYRLLRRLSVNVADQTGEWADQCNNLKASLPNELLDAGTTFSIVPAPTAAPTSAAWKGGLPAVALAAALAMALLAA
ncbi:hypothetical protein C2E21_8079 isoform A [Chlorella sorokiniana]|nr:hypothetical protein C2E21_8079 isoform A [Chlorella sorokiniana]|eukprot:PRW32909.1 hypothetical protein C2E21_8079 isoform A [Chlorella sorokiniana]